MSTNYYAHINLGGPVVKLHIGKSSAGWCFALCVHPEHGINSLADWRTVWEQPQVTIVDEYGDVWTVADLVDTITNREWRGIHDARWWLDNRAVDGPRGLARQTYHATPPPDPANDTYTLISGEFS